MKAPQKTSKFEFKVFFKVLKFFSHKNVFFGKKYSEDLWGWGGGGVEEG
jgi:hypothetical protein